MTRLIGMQSDLSRATAAATAGSGLSSPGFRAA